MAITYVSDSGADGTSSSVTVTAPGSIVAGNLLVAAVCLVAFGSPATFTTPSGWTLLTSAGNSLSDGTGAAIAIYYKAATGSEPGSYTFTLSGPAGHTSSGVVLQYSGTSDFDGSASFTNINSSTTATYSSLSASGSNETAIYFCATGFAAPSTPSGTTARTTSASRCYAFDESGLSGFIGGKSSTLAQDDGITAAMLLSPAAAPSLPPPALRRSIVPLTRASSW